MARRPRQPHRDRRLRPRWSIDRRRQRLLITVGVIIVLAVLAIPAYGYYQKYIAPPRVVAARVGNATISMGDVVKNIRANYAMGAYRDPQALGSAPFEVVQTLVENELVFQEALKQGVTVSDAEIELAIQANFYPTPQAGEEVDVADLEREYKENYQSFLTYSGLSDREFRRMVRYLIANEKMRDRLAAQVPQLTNHVEVYWIALASDGNYRQVDEELKGGKNFDVACKEYNVDGQYADENCYVGWIPEGAFPDLDETLFSIEHDTVSGPVRNESGWVFLKATDGPEVREVSDPMRQQLELQAYYTWTQGLWARASQDKSLRVNFDSRLYEWVQREVRGFIPTPTPVPTVG